MRRLYCAGVASEPSHEFSPPPRSTSLKGTPLPTPAPERLGPRHRRHVHATSPRRRDADATTQVRALDEPTTFAPYFASGEDFHDHFACELTGGFIAPDAGRASFRMSSDDGSRLYINEQLIVDDDGLHSARMREGSVDLMASVAYRLTARAPPLTFPRALP